MDNQVNQYKIKKMKQKKYRASFLTLVFLVILTQLCFSSFRNFHKNINFSSKIKKMEQRKAEEYNKYLKLKNQVENFNSTKNSEAIARNNLKMAEKDEVLIIIKNDDKSQKKSSDSH